MKYDATRVPGYTPHCKTYSPSDYAAFAESACRRDGYRFIGFASEWKGTNRTKVVIECPIHGENSTTNVNRFLNQGTRCPKCSIENSKARAAKGAAHWKSLLVEKCGYSDEIKLEIINGEKWLWCNLCDKDEFSVNGISDGWFRASKGTIYYGGRPCRCSPKYRFSIEERLYLISSRCESLGYRFFKEDHKDLKAKGKILITCPEHGDFESSVGNFLWLKTTCPQCAEFGYQKKLPGLVYLLYSECGQYMKIGLTNRMESRIIGLRSSTPFPFSVAAKKQFECGAEAREYEKRLHSMYTPAKLAGFSGCTEWFRLDGSALLYF